MSEWIFNKALNRWFHPAGLSSDREPSEKETLAMIAAIPLPTTSEMRSGESQKPQKDCGCGGNGRRAIR